MASASPRNNRDHSLTLLPNFQQHVQQSTETRKSINNSSSTAPKPLSGRGGRRDPSPRGGQSPARKHLTPVRSPPRRRRRRARDSDEDENDKNEDNNWTSVVKVFCIHCEPNYALPWTTKAQTSSTSTGFAFKIKSSSSLTGVDEKWLLTNAHSVQHAAVVQVCIV
jgi:hypothetical protein